MYTFIWRLDVSYNQITLFNQTQGLALHATNPSGSDTGTAVPLWDMMYIIFKLNYDLLLWFWMEFFFFY